MVDGGTVGLDDSVDEGLTGNDDHARYRRRHGGRSLLAELIERPARPGAVRVAIRRDRLAVV
jgi:hypothetical protein